MSDYEEPEACQWCNSTPSVPGPCQWCNSTPSVPSGAHTSLKWSLIEDMPHCTIPAGGKLRIAPSYIPYSYGTTAYAKLQLLTNKGWKDLHYVQIMERNENLMTTEEAAVRLKAYAHFLYCT